jgi:hypothetical protein
MSSSVGNIMLQYGTPEMAETARFIMLMDRMFDCMNVRSETEGIRRRKPDLLPYRDENDPRFQVGYAVVYMF